MAYQNSSANGNRDRLTACRTMSRSRGYAGALQLVTIRDLLSRRHVSLFSNATKAPLAFASACQLRLLYGTDPLIHPHSFFPGPG
jgi:hypothetical protein